MSWLRVLESEDWLKSVKLFQWWQAMTDLARWFLFFFMHRYIFFDFTTELGNWSKCIIKNWLQETQSRQDRVLCLFVYFFSHRDQFWEVNTVPLNSLESTRTCEIEDNANISCHSKLSLTQSHAIRRHCLGPYILCVSCIVGVVHQGKSYCRKLGNSIIKWWTQVLCLFSWSCSSLCKMDRLQCESVKETKSIDYIWNIGFSCYRYSWSFGVPELKTITET